MKTELMTCPRCLDQFPVFAELAGSYTMPPLCPGCATSIAMEQLQEDMEAELWQHPTCAYEGEPEPDWEDVPF